MNDGISTRQRRAIAAGPHPFQPGGLGNRRRNLFWLLLFSLTASAATNAVDKLANSDCLDCHTDPSNTRMVNGQKVPLAVFPTNGFARSVHSMLDCMDCHTASRNWSTTPTCRRPTAPAATTRKAKDYATSIHGVSHAMGASGAAQCWDCHGSHDILPVKDPSSPVFKMNLPHDLRQVPQQHRV